MSISFRSLLQGTAWTIGAYGLSIVFRFVTSIVLARLLAPELFGIMTIVYTLRAGIELTTDFGSHQNIIYHKNSEDPEFYNTAWTLQLIRNLILFAIFLLAAVPAAYFYQSHVLVYVIPITALSFVFTGLASVSPNLLQKRLQFAKANAFEVISGLIGSISSIVGALISPTIWGLVSGYIVSSAASMIGTYFLLPDVKQRFYISKRYARQIAHFGKWIFVSSLTFFLAMNFDRLYLAKITPLAVVGVYAIARNISDLVGSLFLRLGSTLLFPFISAHSHMPRDEFRKELAPIRLKFLLVAAFGYSLIVSGADLAIKILYDQRYHAASWMVPVLIIGAWPSILASLGESTLLGLGKPSYTAICNSVKFAILLIGLPVGFGTAGLFGAIVVVACADLGRYIPVLIGQIRERFSFGRQDLLVTVVAIALVVFWEWLRWEAGFGVSFETLPFFAAAN